MTTPAWPTLDGVDGSSPIVSQAGYAEDILSDPTVRSSMDSGEPKARPRYSAVIKTITGQIEVLASTDCDTLLSFYDSDCAFGSLPFTWVHPRTGSAGTFKWQKRPAITGTNGTRYTMSLSIMQLPS